MARKAKRPCENRAWREGKMVGDERLEVSIIPENALSLLEKVLPNWGIVYQCCVPSVKGCLICLR